jgi:hypothetical protein
MFIKFNNSNAVKVSVKPFSQTLDEHLKTYIEYSPQGVSLYGILKTMYLKQKLEVIEKKFQTQYLKNNFYAITKEDVEQFILEQDKDVKAVLRATQDWINQGNDIEKLYNFLENVKPQTKKIESPLASILYNIIENANFEVHTVNCKKLFQYVQSKNKKFVGMEINSFGKIIRQLGYSTKVFRKNDKSERRYIKY